jgi:hypothetical protein
MSDNNLLRVVTPKELADKEAEDVKFGIASNDAVPKFSKLVGHLRKEFRSAKDARYNSGISKRMIDALRTYRSLYSPEKEKDISAFGGSKVHSRVTATKCRGATAMLRDLYLSASDNPWVLEPTPVPTIPEDIASKISGLIQAEIGVAAEAGAQVTPEMLMERLEQLTKQAEKQAVETANSEAAASTDKLNDILIEGDYYKAMREFLIDLPIFPLAAIKGPVVNNVAKTKWKDGKAELIYEAQMQWKRVSPMDLYFTPDAGNLDQSYVIEHIKMAQTDLTALIGVPGYDEEAIRAVLDDWNNARQSQEWRDWFETEREDLESRDFWTTRGKLIDCIEYHGVINAEMLADYDVIPKSKDGKYDSAEMYMVDAWLVDSHILKVQINPSLAMKAPYYVTSFEKVPGSIYGYGLPDILTDIQDVCNATMRALVNNVSISSGPQVIVNDDRLAPGETGNELYPWKRWHINDHPDGSSKGTQPVSFFQPNSNAQELMAIYERFSSMADEASALPKYMTSGTGAGGAGRTASGLAMLMDNASKVMQNVAANVDDDVLDPAITRLYEMVMLTQGDNAVLRGDESVQVRGVTVAVQRETDRMRKLEFLQMTGNPMDMEIVGLGGRAEVLKEIANDLGMDGKMIVPSKAEIEQKVAAQQQAMMQQQEAMMQQGGGQAPQEARDPAMQAREPQENVTRGMVQ